MQRRFRAGFKWSVGAGADKNGTTAVALIIDHEKYLFSEDAARELGMALLDNANKIKPEQIH
jgi:hypothetical protein